MAYTSVLAGLTAAFCWGTADYMSRGLSEKHGYYRVVVYSQIVTLAFLLASIPLTGAGLSFPAYPVFILVIAGLLNFVAFNFLYTAFHRGVVSVVAPIAYTYPAVTAVLSIAILGTYISSVRIVAIGGIIIGVILLSTRFSELRKFVGGGGSPNLTRGVTAAIGSALFFGMVYVGLGYAAPLVALVLPALVLRTVASSAGIVLSPVFKQSVRPSRAIFSKTMIFMGFLEAFGVLSFTYGITASGNALPIVAAISGMGGAVATSYGMAFLKERLELNQLIGVVLSILGVFTLLYFGG